MDWANTGGKHQTDQIDTPNEHRGARTSEEFLEDTMTKMVADSAAGSVVVKFMGPALQKPRLNLGQTRAAYNENEDPG